MTLAIATKRPPLFSGNARDCSATTNVHEMHPPLLAGAISTHRSVKKVHLSRDTEHGASRARADYCYMVIEHASPWRACATDDKQQHETTYDIYNTTHRYNSENDQHKLSVAPVFQCFVWEMNYAPVIVFVCCVNVYYISTCCYICSVDMLNMLER